MRKKRKDHIDIDYLLKHTLGDDMPDGAEKKVHAFISDYTQKIVSGEIHPRRNIYSILKDMFLRSRLDWIYWVFRKEFALIAAFIMVVSGAYLQTSGSESTLTNNLMLFGTSLQVNKVIGGVDSMECSAEVCFQSGERTFYLIRWLFPGETRVDISDLNRNSIKTAWISESGVSLTDHIKNTHSRWKTVDLVDDPHLELILKFLSPQLLSEEIMGRWELKEFEQGEGGEKGSFLVDSIRLGDTIEITVDMQSLLPETLTKIFGSRPIHDEQNIIRMVFEWNLPIAPDLMQPMEQVERNNA